MNNCTCEPTQPQLNDRAALYAFITGIVNLVLTVVIPYMFKLRPVQRVLHPHRQEKREALKGDVQRCILSMQQLAKTLSERSSDSASSGQHSPARLDPL
jgi:hypothetical protein